MKFSVLLSLLVVTNIKTMSQIYTFTTPQLNIEIIEKEEADFMGEIAFNKCYLFLRKNGEYLAVPQSFGQSPGILASKEVINKFIEDKYFPVPINPKDRLELHRDLILTIHTSEDKLIDQFNKRCHFSFDAEKDSLEKLDLVIKRKWIVNKIEDSYFYECVALVGKYMRLKYHAKWGLRAYYGDSLNPSYDPILILSDKSGFIHIGSLIYSYGDSRSSLGLKHFIESAFRNRLPLPASDVFNENYILLD